MTGNASSHVVEQEDGDVTCLPLKQKNEA